MAQKLAKLQNMNEGIEFNESAFRHGISREDIKHALKTRVYDSTLINFPEKYVVIGFDRAGNPLKIIELFRNFSF